MKKLLILAAMAAALILNLNVAVADEASDKDLGPEREVVERVKKSVDERVSDIESVVKAHKAKISALESEAGFTALARGEIYARLEAEHKAVADSAAELKKLVDARCELKKLAATATKKARRTARDVRKLRMELRTLVVRVKELGALDAVKAEQLGKLIGRVVAVEETVKGHEATLKTHAGRLDGHDTAIGGLHDETARLKGQVDVTARGLGEVERRGLRNELSVDVGYTTGIATSGTIVGLSSRLQSGDASFGLILGGDIEVGKDGDKAHVGAAYGRFGLALSSLASPLGAFLVGFAGAASDTSLGTSPCLVGGVEIGGTFRLWRFLSVGASIGPVFGAYSGWKADVFVGLNLLDLIQQVNTPATPARLPPPELE